MNKVQTARDSTPLKNTEVPLQRDAATQCVHIDSVRLFLYIWGCEDFILQSHIRRAPVTLCKTRTRATQSDADVQLVL